MSYKNYNEWKHWSADAFGKPSVEESIYFAAEMSRCDVRKLTNLRILEIGFGNGAFAGWAKREGASYQGTEIIPDLVQRGRENGFDVYPDDVPLRSIAENASLDIVVAWDVLEHIDRQALAPLFLLIRDALNEGGLLVARLPSGDSPFARSIQHGDLTHCSTLGSSAVHQLAASTGFLVEQVREPAFPLFGQGPLSMMRRSLIKLARVVIYPLVTKLLMGGGKPVLSPNMVFTLRKSAGITRGSIE